MYLRFEPQASNSHDSVAFAAGTRIAPSMSCGTTLDASSESAPNLEDTGSMSRVLSSPLEDSKTYSFVPSLCMTTLDGPWIIGKTDSA